MTDSVPDRPQHLVRLWPDPEEGPFRLRIWFGRVGGRLAVVGVEMWGTDPVEASWAALEDAAALHDAALPADTPIKAVDIRVPLGELLDGWVAMHRRYASAARSLGVDESTVSRFESSLGSERRGRPRLTDEHLRRVADTYRAAVADSDRRPALRVQQELGAHTPATARGWIRQARKRGFLAPAQPDSEEEN